jgi:hypothetical protein
MSTFQKALLVLLCAAIAGNGPLVAGPPAFYGETPPTAIADLSLTVDGDLVGRYLDNEGRAVEGASVEIAQGGKIIARRTTDSQGAYRLPKLASGVYQLTIGSETEIVRAWPHEVAPPAAKPMLTTIRPGEVVRGQFGGGGLDFGTLIGIAGLTVGTIALIEAEDAKDEASKLRRDMTSMTTGVVSP